MYEINLKDEVECVAEKEHPPMVNSQNSLYQFRFDLFIQRIDEWFHEIICCKDDASSGSVKTLTKTTLERSHQYTV